MAVWIDEAGTIVRNAESAVDRAQPAPRHGDPRGPARAADPAVHRGQGDPRRRRGATAPPSSTGPSSGADSPFALTRRRGDRTLPAAGRGEAEAAACFELGQHLRPTVGDDAAVPWWRRAHELDPDNWTYKRQAWTLVTTPEGASENDLIQGPNDVYDGNWLDDVIARGGGAALHDPPPALARPRESRSGASAAAGSVPGDGARALAGRAGAAHARRSCRVHGWNDAGDAASRRVRTLVERWGARPWPRSTPSRSPTSPPSARTSASTTGSARSSGRPSASGRPRLPGGDVLLVLGPEPALRWKLFCDQLVGVAERFGVPMTISLGALLADVPHTRPVQIIGTASDPDLIDRFELQRVALRGPDRHRRRAPRRASRAPASRRRRCGPPCPATPRRSRRRRRRWRSSSGPARCSAPRRRSSRCCTAAGRVRRPHRRADRRRRRPRRVRQPAGVDGRRRRTARRRSSTTTTTSPTTTTPLDAESTPASWSPRSSSSSATATLTTFVRRLPPRRSPLHKHVIRAAPGPRTTPNPHVCASTTAQAITSAQTRQGGRARRCGGRRPGRGRPAADSPSSRRRLGPPARAGAAARHAGSRRRPRRVHDPGGRHPPVDQHEARPARR